jgi:hypothetical protein
MTPVTRRFGFGAALAAAFLALALSGGVAQRPAAAGAEEGLETASRPTLRTGVPVHSAGQWRDSDVWTRRTGPRSAGTTSTRRAWGWPAATIRTHRAGERSSVSYWIHRAGAGPRSRIVIHRQ